MYTLLNDYKAEGTNVVPEGMMIRNLLLTRIFKAGEQVDGIKNGDFLTVKTDGGTDYEGNPYTGNSTFDIPLSQLQVLQEAQILPITKAGFTINPKLVLIAACIGGGYLLISSYLYKKPI